MLRRCLVLACVALPAAAQTVLPFPRLPTVGTPWSVVVADLDRDARPDVVLGVQLLVDGVPRPAVTVLRGDGWGDAEALTVELDSALPGGVPILAAVGDVDGAFGLDVVALSAADEVFVLRDDGAGGFDVLPPLVVSGAELLRVGDIDGDGIGDLVVLRGAPDLDAATFVGDGLGGFTPGPSSPVGLVSDARLVDVDGDAVLDLVAVGNNVASVRLGDGSGGFVLSSSASLPAASSELAVGDVDADGWLDVALDLGSLGLGVVRGGPAGQLQVVEVLGDAAPDGETAVDVAIDDVDGDGIDDVVVVTNASGFGFAWRGWLRTFTGVRGELPALATTSQMHLTVLDVELVDFDVDGTLDVLLRTDRGTTWARGLGDARFDATSIGPTFDLEPRDVDLGDFDGDGDLDAVVQHQYDCDLSVVFDNPGDGDLRFGDVLPATLEFMTQARSGDVDGDGDDEVLVLGTTAVLLDQAESGAWLPMSAPANPLGDPTFTDVDGDGFVDLVGGGRVQYGDGTGQFPTSVTYDSWNRAVDVADVDGDGHRDVVLAQPDEVKVVFFEPELEIVTWATTPHASALGVGDFDGDGDVDVAVGQNEVSSSADADVVVLFGDGARGVERTATIDVGGRLLSMGAVDIDRDGELDLVAVDGGGFVVVFGAPGGFDGVRRFIADDAHALALGDVDGDGRVDAVTVGTTSANMTVSKARAPAAASPVPGGVAGASGEPLLKITSSWQAGDRTTLRVVSAPPRASGFVVLGSTTVSAPFAGGILVPDVDVLIGPITTDADGVFAATGPWPSAVPNGTAFWLQAWLGDATAPFGWAGSEGVKVVVP